jgi:hypothetical protein
MNIVDTLLLEPEELQMLRNEYNIIEITNLTNTSQNVQEYVIQIELDDEEDYYNFLLDNWLSRSSTKFLSKLINDLNFAERIRQRLGE